MYRPLAILCLLALTQPASPADLDDTLSSKIAEALKQAAAPSVSVAIARGGKVIFARSFGKANLAESRDATTETRYAVGSISKEFTAASLLLLEEKHKLSLNDKVAKYFPHLTRAGEMTIRQLLNHTSGYEDYAPQDYLIPEWEQPTTSTRILDQWAKKPLNFEPGTRWQYSNTNYVLAAAIFEKVSGKPLVGFLREKIFEPLGMSSAGDCSAASPADATAYTRYGLGPARPVAREAPGWYNGAGELCMTALDLSKWDLALLRRRLLSPRSYGEFLQEAKLADGDRTHYALGLEIGEWHNIPSVYHGGEVSGFLAINTLYPTRNTAIVVLSNQDNQDLIFTLTSQISALLFLPEEPRAVEKDTAQARSILEGLQQGKIDRTLFTANANAYFTEVALGDFQTSLSPLGKLRSLQRTGESLRGGMTHRSYRAQFEKSAVSLNIYVMPDGKYEQFLVEE